MAKPYFTLEEHFTNPNGIYFDKKALAFASAFLAPPVGLEPTTCGLTVRRSTD